MALTTPSSGGGQGAGTTEGGQGALVSAVTVPQPPPSSFSSFVPPFELGANRSASGGQFLFRLEFGSKF